MPMLSLFIALSLQAMSGQEITFPSEQVESWSTFEAADQLLDAEQARDLVDGEFGRSGPFRWYSGRWWTQAQVTGELLGQRESYEASLLPIEVRTPRSPWRSDRRAFIEIATTYPEPATPQACASKTEWINADQATLNAKVIGLTRLIEAINAASNDDDLPFEISCESTSAIPCGDARQALRSLPLETLYDLRPLAEQYRSEPTVNGVGVRYAVRPADGVYSAYEAHFGPHTVRDSWFVTLQGRDRLERVTIRRATVIYH